MNFLTKPRFKLFGRGVNVAQMIGFVIGFTTFQYFID